VGKSKKSPLSVKSDIKSLAWIKLFAGTAVAATLAIWSVFINSFVDSPAITGLISGVFAFAAFLSFFLFIPLVQKTRKGKLFISTLIITIASYIMFAFVDSLTTLIFAGILLSVAGSISVTAFGLIIKDKSKKSNLTKNEGFIFTFMNIGYVIGPLIGGYVAAVYGVKSVFWIVAFLMLISLFIFKANNIEDKRVQKPEKNAFKNFLNFFKDKQRVIVYILGGGPQFWWVLIYVFAPLFIIEKGLTTKAIGIFLFAAAVPLILTEYYFSRKVRKYGFKKMFQLGFLIPTIAGVLCFFLTGTYSILIVLVLASFGIAMLEPTTESYFLGMVTTKESGKFYGPFNTNITVNQVASKILPSLLLLILPFSYIFLIYGAFMFVFFLVSFKVKDSKI